MKKHTLALFLTIWLGTLWAQQQNEANQGLASNPFSPGSPIVFTTSPSFSGLGVTQTDSSTFTFSQAGNYFVIFFGNTVPSNSLGGVTLTLNGINQGNPSFLEVGEGEPIILNQIVTVTSVPATLQVMVVGYTLSLVNDSPGSINIISLN